MVYTIEQKQAIRRSFSRKDREKLAEMYGAVTSRQIANGLRRVSLSRALEIADAIGRKSIVKRLLPELS